MTTATTTTTTAISDASRSRIVAEMAADLEIQHFRNEAFMVANNLQATDPCPGTAASFAERQEALNEALGRLRDVYEAIWPQVLEGIAQLEMPPR